MLLVEHLAKAKSGCRPEDIEVYTKTDLEIAQTKYEIARDRWKRLFREEQEKSREYSKKINNLSKKIHNASIFTNVEKVNRQMEELRSQDRFRTDYYEKNYAGLEKDIDDLRERINIVERSLRARGEL